ncbi:hypothetical protein CONPUDRAFT_165772 [Coniophora puteana RWD-64-598 SS2]|uniref:F-box domain-containing protein n=1 Tax=Coniophora puteana (strain RWD-64-598) TaxID=741705 RepID=A0A5M3MMA2_CONPW|nr:uncharacterized protein CONPUDRAFT_165772 [Coniophora puteana RWD-64-598 SS2]EIW80176.1 hypothetical protein CONPUDRAFT_165772 [Coniophora puteana RWD-64-598 SS2]
MFANTRRQSTRPSLHLFPQPSPSRHMSEMPVPLADELFNLVFLELDIVSLVACKRVCKRFLHLIESTERVQYHFELQAACMKDGPSRSGTDLPELDTATRFGMLKVYRRAWEALSWTGPFTIPLSPLPPHAEKYVLVGDVLCAAGSKYLQCTRLPSPIRGIEERQWRIDHPCEDKPRSSEYGLAIDPAQDLLALAEDQGRGASFKVHLLTLSAGVPHPTSAPSGTISYTYDYGYSYIFRWRFDVQIHGSYLGLLADEHYGGVNNHLIIWDWVSGQVICEIRDDDNGFNTVQSFTFLPKDLVLLGLRLDSGLEDSPCRVKSLVHDLAAARSLGGQTITQVDDIPYLCVFEFPSYTGQFQGMDIQSTSSLGQSPRASTWYCSPFIPDTESQQVSLIQVFVEGEPQESLFLPFSIISHHISSYRTEGRQGIRIPWDAWGPAASLKLRHDGPFAMWRSEAMCCPHLVILFDDTQRGPPHPRPQHLLLKDFNTYAARRNRANHTDIPSQWHSFSEQTVLINVEGRWATLLLPQPMIDYMDGEILLGQDSIVFAVGNPRIGSPLTFMRMTLVDPENVEEN